MDGKVLVSIALLISVIVFPVQAKSNKTSIYRWIDDNNIVHYSQYQPKNGQYSQLTTIASYRAQKKRASLENNGELKSQDEIAKQNKVLAKNKEIFTKNCITAQLNIKMLNSLNKILDTDPKTGKAKVLSAEDKKERIKISKKQVALYCDKK